MRHPSSLARYDLDYIRREVQVQLKLQLTRKIPSQGLAQDRAKGDVSPNAEPTGN